MPILNLNDAVGAIREGKIIAYPTEAVYGLGCDPFNHDAVNTLIKLKQRDPHAGLILVASRFEQLTGVVADLPAGQLKPATDTWPGPVTWLLPAAAGCPPWIPGGHLSVAVRVSSHPVSKQLCEHFGGPLVSTSANRSGQSPARTIEQVEQYFQDSIAGVVEGALGDLEKPTEIRDLLTGKVIR